MCHPVANNDTLPRHSNPSGHFDVSNTHTDLAQVYSLGLPHQIWFSSLLVFSLCPSAVPLNVSLPTVANLLEDMSQRALLCL